MFREGGDREPGLSYLYSFEMGHVKDLQIIRKVERLGEAWYSENTR